MEDKGNISDGYHTFDELYEHRIVLFAALLNRLPKRKAWKSRKHDDGSSYEGWFIAGYGIKEGEQITYHIPDSHWDLFKVEEKERAPVWDLHTPNDVLDRLRLLI